MRYRVRVRRGDWEIEVESEDQAYVEQKLREFETSLSAASPSVRSLTKPAIFVRPADESARSLSLVELKNLVRPDSGSESTATVAYYLEKFKGQSEYAPKELIQGLKELRCNFKNYHDVILKTVNPAGFLMRGSSKKVLRLTDTGERWVEVRLRGSQDAPEAPAAD